MNSRSINRGQSVFAIDSRSSVRVITCIMNHPPPSTDPPHDLAEQSER
ncbi:hypothetical protein OAS86_02845 [Gammaproteobacteria bacterium]|nr:hypothetical protein [Gammaproteobacteria bacterium]